MSVNIFLCGDIYAQVRPFFIDKSLKHIIKKSDIAMCNLEGPIMTELQRPIQKVGPHIFQSEGVVPYLFECGFTLFSLANNHIYDYGQAGLHKTITTITSKGGGYMGAGNTFHDAYAPKIIEKQGVRIGFISAAEGEFGCLIEEKDETQGGYAWINHPKIEDTIRTLKNRNLVDVLILSVHAGVEDIDIPLKEWRARYQRLCDIGVDVIVGHHPHVPQGYEQYRDSYIFYSLGNFYFETSDRNDESYSVSLTVEEDASIDFDIIYHKKVGDLVQESQKDAVVFSLFSLNQQLHQSYSKSHDDLVVSLFHKYYWEYYRTVVGLPSTSATVSRKIIHVVRSMFSKEKRTRQEKLLLLHNIRIESHRYVVQRALSLLYEK